MRLRLASFLTMVACTAGTDIPLDTGTGPGRDCGTGLWGESFASIEELECGLGPDGPVLCHWTLTFGEATYDWSYSDVSDSGTVTCEDNDLVGTSTSGATHQGTFHRSTARVTWDGVSYAQVD